MNFIRNQAGLRWLAFMLLGGLVGPACEAQPVVSNVQASQRAGTGFVDIYYDLSSPSNRLTVSLVISTTGGVAFNAPAVSLSGALGAGIAPGTGEHLEWNAGADLAALYFPNVKVRVKADDGSQPPAPAGMALIPAGSFQMGDSVDGESDAPVTTVYVSAFYMDQTDVTYSLWQTVYNWAIAHGYSFDHAGSGKAANHPVQTLDWYDCVKWCNARSEMEGRTPAYYTGAAQTAVYRTGDIDLANGSVNWGAGYRLPTEAEWEKAARGGLSGQRFPWGNTISWSQANYYGYPLSLTQYGYAYDFATAIDYDPAFSGGDSGAYPYTSPVSYFAPNGYGLYDMAGNVWQWCWDWYGTYAGGSDPRGPSSGSYRVLRGGDWDYYAMYCRTAYRFYGPGGGYNVGFRSVLSPGQ